MKMPNKKFNLYNILKSENLILLSAPALPHLILLACKGVYQSQTALKHKYAWPYSIVVYYGKKRMVEVIYDESIIVKKAEHLLKNKMFLKSEFSAFLKRMSELFSVFEKFEKNGITDVKKEYFVLLNKLNAFWEYGVLPEYFLVCSDVYVKRLIKKYGKIPEIDILCTPDHKSFIAEEHLSLLKLARSYKKRKKIFQKKLLEHSKKFYWIHSNYASTPELNVDYFLNEIKKLDKSLSYELLEKEISNLENYEFILKNKKINAIKSSKLSKEDINILRILAFMAHWQDLRKKGGTIGNYWVDRCLRKGSEFLEIPYFLLSRTLPEEFEALLNSKKMDTQILEKRRKGFALLITPKKEVWLDKEEVNKIYLRLRKQVVHSDTSKIKGFVASKGSAIGKVSIVIDPFKKRLKEGEVLVTTMTRPEFAPYMRKACAIVTDEGGITSHAAILSRELNKPCIIGTKFATQVLKDGDLVEVDANNGVVKILRKYK